MIAENSFPDPQSLVEMRGIGKSFGPVRVLDRVDFTVRPGEVHLLAGENGAGKSTLIKILAGIHTSYDGTIFLKGKPIRFTGPLDAAAHGIAVIHQELSLIPSLSVAENMFLGRLPQRRGGFVDRSRLRENARELMERFELDVDVDRLVEHYPISVKQMIEIAKSLGQNADVIIMDEPTSALNAPEVERLFGQIARLRANRCGIVYITHKMEEIQRVSDRITVLRDGTLIGSEKPDDLPVPKLIEWMVGRKVEKPYERSATDESKDILFQTRNLSLKRRGKTLLKNISLKVRRGEIVGLAGLQGSGASTLLEGLFGAYADAVVLGEILLEDKTYRIHNPRKSIDQGVALLTNDRKANGLVLSMSIIENMTLACDRKPWIDNAKETEATETTGKSMNLSAASLKMDVGLLSGGNQQKVASGKWFLTRPKLLMLDEPTRGVDIGAKQDIYRLIDQWTQNGGSVLLITSEMPELLALADRILVMHRGEIAAEFEGKNADPNVILSVAMGETHVVGSAF